ncbi:hypothetical protein EC957_001281 [Mortierella hygrophila]|uniref:Uncharacterized protein n=1 Tax=Mortierella hygrophila TaxID=979708 RepID=A0A9P6F5Q8_9FUNG|nr:hypothetical protein EC957_001281 [Mortierella hygrophila]
MSRSILNFSVRHLIAKKIVIVATLRIPVAIFLIQAQIVILQEEPFVIFCAQDECFELLEAFELPKDLNKQLIPVLIFLNSSVMQLKDQFLQPKADPVARDNIADPRSDVACIVLTQL